MFLFNYYDILRFVFNIVLPHTRADSCEGSTDHQVPRATTLKL